MRFQTRPAVAKEEMLLGGRLFVVTDSTGGVCLFELYNHIQGCPVSVARIKLQLVFKLAFRLQ